MKRRLLLYILLALVIQSCTITKRYHSLGYQIEWNRQLSPKSKSELSLKKTDIAQIETIGVNTRSNRFADAIVLESRENDDLKSSFRASQTAIPKNSFLRHKLEIDVRNKVLPVNQAIVHFKSKHQNQPISKSKIFYVGLCALAISILGFALWSLSLGLLYNLGGLLMIMGIPVVFYSIVKIIHEQRKGKKQHKVGVVAMLFLTLGVFFMAYAFLGALNIWAAFGFFILGFFAICIFLIIVAVKAINRRAKRPKQTS